MVEVFCGILAGAQYSKHVRTWKVTDRVANLVRLICLFFLLACVVVFTCSCYPKSKSMALILRASFWIRHRPLDCLFWVSSQCCHPPFHVFRANVLWQSTQRTLPPVSATGCQTCCPSREAWSLWVDPIPADLMNTQLDVDHVQKFQCIKTKSHKSNFGVVAAIVGWCWHSSFDCWRPGENEHEEVWGDGWDSLPHQCCQLHGKTSWRTSTNHDTQ